MRLKFSRSLHLNANLQKFEIYSWKFQHTCSMCDV